MSRYVLDTSAYSHFKRGDPQVVELIDSAEWLGLPAVVLGELEVGFLLGKAKQRAANQAALRELLTHPLVEELAIDHETGRLYAEITVALRRAGTPIPTNDIWIAAAAAREGVTVLTYDHHFKAISRVASHVLTPTAPRHSP